MYKHPQTQYIHTYTHTVSLSLSHSHIYMYSLCKRFRLITRQSFQIWCLFPNLQLYSSLPSKTYLVSFISFFFEKHSFKFYNQYGLSYNYIYLRLPLYEAHKHRYIYTHTHTHTHIYIYINIHTYIYRCQ
jgi:hypothetical protein